MTKRIPACCVWLLFACGPELDASDGGSEMLETVRVWPEQLSALHAPGGIAYRPAHELWSNGSHKRRALFLPDGAVIDTSDRARWRFPRGTLLLKTFSYRRSDGSEHPVETRALRSLGDEGFDYAAYVWSGDDAQRADLAQPLTREIDHEDGALEHVVPSRLQCRECHESQEVAVLGFDELGLSEALEAGSPTQLAALHDAGVLSDLPEGPSRLEHADAETRAVLGYFEGNCVHCHNGSGLASSAFDLRHTVALDNLIDQPSEGQSIGGIRVVPGDAEASALYRALEGERLFPDVAAMPPVGVQARDEDAIERVRTWIEGMQEDGP